jgi:hypothetical protein
MIETLVMAGKMTVINVLRFFRLNSLADRLDQHWAGK